jgi:small subunit ribosomal protein S12
MKVLSKRTLKLSKLSPQLKVVTLKVLTMSPKKPNSANRRIIKSRSILSNQSNIGYVPGEGHNLQQHSTVLLQHDRLRDLIGVKHSVIRGKFDLIGVLNRKTSRSLYGVKKILT